MDYSEVIEKRDAAKEAEEAYNAAYKKFVEQELETSGLKDKWVCRTAEPELVGKLVVYRSTNEERSPYCYPYFIGIRIRKKNGTLGDLIKPVYETHCTAELIAKQLSLYVREAES